MLSKTRNEILSCRTIPCSTMCVCVSKEINTICFPVSSAATNIYNASLKAPLALITFRASRNTHQHSVIHIQKINSVKSYTILLTPGMYCMQWTIAFIACLERGFFESWVIQIWHVQTAKQIRKFFKVS